MVKKIVFFALDFLARGILYIQGKGYGSFSIGQEVSLVMAKLNKTPQLAIDVGGNIGDYTAELKRLHPSLEVHVFEPSTINIEKLKLRYVSTPDVFIVPVALSNANGSGTLHSNVPGSGLGSLTKRNLDHLNTKFEIHESVNIIRFLDYWVDKLDRRIVDIVKIDVEGHELDVLSGFGEALERVRVFQFEFGGCNIDTRTYFRDFWLLFSARNFTIYRISPLGLERLDAYRERDEFFSTTNFLAVNQRHL